MDYMRHNETFGACKYVHYLCCCDSSFIAEVLEFEPRAWWLLGRHSTT
jgi:hypothetical protein